MDARRVVTGHDADGKAVFVSDELGRAGDAGAAARQRVPPDLGRRRDRVVPRRRLAAVGAASTSRRSAGSASGSSPSRPTAAPARRADLDIVAALAEFDEKLPGMAEHLEPDDPGMHTTATHRLRRRAVGPGHPRARRRRQGRARTPGDTYIQNGTRHRWSNTGDVPAVLAIALIGAHHRNVG